MKLEKMEKVSLSKIWKLVVLRIWYPTVPQKLQSFGAIFSSLTLEFCKFSLFLQFGFSCAFGDSRADARRNFETGRTSWSLILFGTSPYQLGTIRRLRKHG